MHGTCEYESQHCTANELKHTLDRAIRVCNVGHQQIVTCLVASSFSLSISCHICNFAGQGRACLLRSINAAAVMQRAVRVWQFRLLLLKGRHRRLNMLLAVSRLQAMWRARQPYRLYSSLRRAVITTQVKAKPSCADLSPLLNAYQTNNFD